MKVTFYLDACSLWFLFAERSFARLIREYGDRLSTHWKLALSDGDTPAQFTRGLEIVVRDMARLHEEALACFDRGLGRLRMLDPW